MEAILPILLVFVVGFMFLSVRRQKKAQAQVQEMQDALQPGARVQTTAGLYATVVGVDDGVVDLELAPGIVTRWNRLAIREVVHDEDLAGSFPGAPVHTTSIDDDVAHAESVDPDLADPSSHEVIDGQGNGVSNDSVSFDKRPDTN
ncbi:preprotein translocase subunit YajC [Williamsia sterculiae]|uniref:Preprotein translocase subunit YajC n=1 Tax=Williamsia sterculiae TaxID=1344003 RepID=A0A1N7EGL2_9NOCA|nr:preprotein translocase subunit YajC [Williamsia sterculiae]SIR87292.1 preprotein translocase subunit YajC [Williamsia sterculiae]